MTTSTTEELLPPKWASAVAPNSGKTYYYHLDTKVTTWRKPPLFKEYEDKASGRKYYHNLATDATQWDEPALEDIISSPEMEAFVLTGEKMPAGSVPTASSSSTGFPSSSTAAVEYTSMTEDRSRNQVVDPATLKTPEERKRAFASLVEFFLETKMQSVAATASASSTGSFNPNAKVSSSGTYTKIKWEELLKAGIESDPRFQCVESGGERKQIFHETTQRLEIQKREQDRKAKHHARHDLLEALRMNYPAKKRGLTFREAAGSLQALPCWHVLQDDFERDEVFQEFQEEWEREERAERKRLRAEKLKELEEKFSNNPDLRRSQVTWREVLRQYKDDPTFNSLTKAEALSAFQSYLQATGEKMQKQARSFKYRLERDARAAFKKWLKDRTCSQNEDFKQLDAFLKTERKNAGKEEYLRAPDNAKLITVECSWAECLNWYDLTKQKVYENMLGNSGSKPDELFKAHMEEIREQLEEDRARVEAILAEEAEKSNGRGFAVHRETTLDEFHEFLRRRKRVNPVHTRVLWQDLVTLADKQKQKAEKSEKKARQRLVLFLAERKEVGPSMKYSEAEARFRDEPVWEAVDPEQRKAMFQTFIEQISHMQQESARRDKRRDEETSDESSGAEQYEMSEESDRRTKKRSSRGEKRSKRSRRRKKSDGRYQYNSEDEGSHSEPSRKKKKKKRTK
ncbi:unnamed protein product [Amoebophrya sp. A25]|nr:unnamed protein product [Amoebophrya sp. A25]|eukprot:GSA25T00014867001.1